MAWLLAFTAGFTAGFATALIWLSRVEAREARRGQRPCKPTPNFAPTLPNGQTLKNALGCLSDRFPMIHGLNVRRNTTQ